MSNTINREKFYSSIKLELFPTGLKQSQVDGIEAVLNFWDASGWEDRRWLAYILGTIYHEVAATMQPIEERGKGKGKDYGKKLKYGKGPGKRIPYIIPDKIYYGMGLTQNTWFEVYEALTKEACRQGKDWDFLNYPELLLQMEPSVWATFTGMTKGIYTGKKLAHYFNTDKEDWVHARRIINVLDKAELIAGYAKSFYSALQTANE